MRMPPHEFLHNCVGNAVNIKVSSDPGVKNHLQQDIPELLAERGHVPGLQRLQRFVRLLKEMRRKGQVGLLRVPWALGAQPLHGRHQVQQVRTGQIAGPSDNISTVKSVRSGRREPHASSGNPSGNLVPDPGRFQRRKLRMPGRSQHHVGRPEYLPGLPRQQPGRDARTGYDDAQPRGSGGTVLPGNKQAGVSPVIAAAFLVPDARDTLSGVLTTV